MYPDFKELLLAFNAHDVEYLVVGAHALAAPAFVISRHHLIKNKKTAARLQDLADVQTLEEIGD